MYRKSVLTNGLRVLTSEMPHTRSATVSIYVGAGSRYEADEEAGLSHFLEHMLFKGASRRPTAKEISVAIEGVGGISNAATDRELTVYYAKVPHTAVLEAVDVLADMVSAPIMDPAELEKERHVILEELAAIEDNPAELAGILVDETLWPDQPLGRTIGGTPESVRSLPASAVERYLRAQYVPGNMVLAVAGNVRHEEVVEAAERWLGAMRPGTPRAWFPAVGRNGAAPVAVREKVTEQAHVCIAFPSVPLGHPDRYAVDIVSALLGEGMSSRLFLELREERALVYDVHSYASGFRDAGCLTIYAGCDPENARVTAEAIVEEVEKLRGGVPEDELEKAKEMVRGRVLLRLEDTRAVSGWLGAQELLLDRVLTVDDVLARIDAVAAEDVTRVMNAYFRPEQAVLAAVGPFEDTALFEGLVGSS